MSFIHLLHIDLAQTLSDDCLNKQQTGLIEALRYYYLGVLKRLPRTSDFKVNGKYKPLQIKKLEPREFSNFNPETITFYNLDEVTLYSENVYNEFATFSKTASIISFVRRILKLSFTEKNKTQIHFLMHRQIFLKPPL